MANSLVPMPGPGDNGYRPNFTMGGRPPIPVPGTGLGPANYSPNFTMGTPPPVDAPNVQGMRRPPMANPTPVADALATEARAPTLLGRAATGLGRAAGAGLRMLGPSAAGADVVSHFNDYKINDPSTDSSARGTWNALKSGDLAGFGRSLSKGALETGMDLGSAAANVADYVVPGKAPVSTAYNQMLHNQFGSQLTDQSSAAPQQGPPTSLAGTPPAAALPNIMPPQPPPGGPLTPTDSMNPPGRAVDGVPGIRRVDAPGQNPLYTDGSNVRGPSVVGNDMGAIQRGADAEHRLGLAKMGMQDRGDANYYTSGAGRNGPTSSGVDTGGYGLDHAGAARKGGGDIEALARSGKLSGAGLGAVVQARGQDQSAAVSERGQDVGAETARMQNNTAAWGHQLTADVGMRGQDGTLMGHRMANDVARAQMAREQGNFETTYNAGRVDAGNTQDAKHFDQRASAMTALHTEIANQLPQIDGKPDTETAARYAQGLGAQMASRQQALQHELATNPGNAEARSELAGITQNGVGSMDPTAKRNLVAGMQLKEMRTANHSAWNPFAATDVESAAPVSGIRKRSGLISDDYQTLGANGKPDGGSIPAKLIDQPGSIFGLGGKRSNTYDTMKPTK